ncbi:MAG: 2-amino-4-hydroxy-6-hydroxymethyldihydropteridine diphosphokinase [Pseudomonadales bacterium]
MALGRIYLALGSNSNATRNLESALWHLQKVFGSLVISTVYSSEPLAGEGEDYLNAVVSFAFQGELEALKERLLVLEQKHGRVRVPGGLETALDLDILGLQGIVGAGRMLKVPEQALSRSFVLAPLAELAPDLLESRSQLSFSQLWQQMDQQAHPLTAVAIEVRDHGVR